MTEEIDPKKELKPVSKASIITQNAVSGTVTFVGVCTTVAGAFFFMKSRNPERFFARATHKASIGALAAGAISTIAGLVGINVAIGASRARGYAEREELRRAAEKSAQHSETSPSR
jgi:hypothetical protein